MGSKTTEFMDCVIQSCMQCVTIQLQSGGLANDNKIGSYLFCESLHARVNPFTFHGYI